MDVDPPSPPEAPLPPIVGMPSEDRFAALDAPVQLPDFPGQPFSICLKGVFYRHADGRTKYIGPPDKVCPPSYLWKFCRRNVQDYVKEGLRWAELASQLDTRRRSIASDVLANPHLIRNHIRPGSDCHMYMCSKCNAFADMEHKSNLTNTERHKNCTGGTILRVAVVKYRCGRPLLKSSLPATPPMLANRAAGRSTATGTADSTVLVPTTGITAAARPSNQQQHADVDMADVATAGAISNGVAPGVECGSSATPWTWTKSHGEEEGKLLVDVKHQKMSQNPEEYKRLRREMEDTSIAVVVEGIVSSEILESARTATNILDNVREIGNKPQVVQHFQKEETGQGEECYVQHKEIGRLQGMNLDEFKQYCSLREKAMGNTKEASSSDNQEVGGGIDVTFLRDLPDNSEEKKKFDVTGDGLYLLDLPVNKRECEWKLWRTFTEQFPLEPFLPGGSNCLSGHVYNAPELGPNFCKCDVLVLVNVDAIVIAIAVNQAESHWNQNAHQPICFLASHLQMWHLQVRPQTCTSMGTGQSTPSTFACPDGTRSSS